MFPCIVLDLPYHLDLWLTKVSISTLGGTIRKKPNEGKEGIRGVLNAIEKIASTNEARLLRKQFVEFHMRKGLFATTSTHVDAVSMDAI